MKDTEWTPEKREKAYQDGQRAIRDFERENAQRLPHIGQAEVFDRPNWTRDRNKGAAGD